MSGNRGFATISPAFASVLVAVAAGVGLLGVRMSPVIPAVAGPWAVDGMVMPQAVLGLPLLVGAVATAMGRAVDRRLPGVVAGAVCVAAVAGVLAGAGGLPLAAGVWCVRVTFAGLFVAYVAAAVAIGAAAGIGRPLAAVGVVPVAVAAGALCLLSMHPVLGPLAEPQNRVLVGRVMAVSMPAGIWGLIWIGVLASIRRRPEYGGRVPRPPVRLRCPRCGCRQRQQGAEGCRRCGLDVRIESA